MPKIIGKNMSTKWVVAIGLPLTCILLVCLWGWCTLNKVKRFHIEGDGVIVDGGLQLPLARFDKLDMVAEVDDHGKILEPYHFKFYRKGRSGNTETEELIIVPVKKDGQSFLRENFVSGSIRRLVGRFAGRSKMPDSLVGEHVSFTVERNDRIKPNITITISKEPGCQYEYGHPHGEKVYSESDEQILAPLKSTEPFAMHCVRHGAGKLSVPPVLGPALMDRSFVTDADMNQVDGDEYLCRSWFLRADGSFLMLFFVRELGSLKDLVRGRVEGKFDLEQNRIAEQHVVYEPKELRNVSIRISAREEKEGKKGMIRVVFQHGRLCLLEDFPISRLIKHSF